MKEANTHTHRLTHQPQNQIWNGYGIFSDMDPCFCSVEVE